MAKLLHQIKKNPGLSQNDLVDILEVSKESISISVRRLEKKGFIIREIDQTDKRKNLLYLSEQGLDILDKVWVSQNETYELLLEPLSEQEKQELQRLFELIMDSARQKELV